jgi:hypothetical protein
MIKRDHQILDQGAKWIAPYIRRIVWEGQWGGYISSMCWHADLRRAYEAGLRDEDRCPPWLHSRHQSAWSMQHLHAAYMIGLTDFATRAELRRDRDLRALCARIEDMVTDSQLATHGLFVRPLVLLLKDRK